MGKGLIKIVWNGVGLGDGPWQHAFGFYGNHIILILQNYFDHEKLLRTYQQTIFLKQVWIDNGVSNPGFILQTQKDKSFCRPRALAGDNAPSDTCSPAVGEGLEFNCPANSSILQLLTMIGHRMRADGQPSSTEIGDQSFFIIHPLKWRF